MHTFHHINMHTLTLTYVHTHVKLVCFGSVMYSNLLPNSSGMLSCECNGNHASPDFFYSKCELLTFFFFLPDRTKRLLWK